MNYSLLIDPAAIRDIQGAIDYYDDQRPGLGRRFENELHEHLLRIEKNPFFNLRYQSVRCVPLNKFPYMIHFTLNEQAKTVCVRAVFHTSIDPKKWPKK